MSDMTYQAQTRRVYRAGRSSKNPIPAYFVAAWGHWVIVNAGRDYGKCFCHARQMQYLGVVDKTR